MRGAIADAGRSDRVRDNITDTPLQASGSDGCPKGRDSCPRDGQHLIEATFGLPGAQRPHGMILPKCYDIFPIVIFEELTAPDVAQNVNA
ncbi:hypothetical protein D9613_006347 [Agrocybe pediades]|uniref:Uncharacterized protein n=1 Tax=Agrocybe pediades TaxID=84607 RepID=A0A8H4QWY4_9AGAR|nr:hypothetical protein D9613_006347 [Agrocybe pediades]